MKYESVTRIRTSTFPRSFNCCRYSLTGGEALSNWHVAEKISRVAGRKISYVDLPPAEFKKAILSAGIPEWSADALLDLQRLYREGKGTPVSDDLERLTGRKPIAFDQFAHDYAFAFQTEARRRVNE